MKAVKVKGFRCPECDEFIGKDDIPELGDFWMCGECGETYDTKGEAQECCS